MPRYIVKLVDATNNKDYYLEWSTVVDAPVTHGMGLTQFTEYYQQEYGQSGMDGFDDRLKCVHEKGTSARYYDSAEDLVSFNRAGPGESPLTYEELVLYYCLKVDASEKHPIWDFRRKASDWLCEGNFWNRQNFAKLADIFSLKAQFNQATVLTHDEIEKMVVLEQPDATRGGSRQKIIGLMEQANVATKANLKTILEIYRSKD